eukprot:TRINITY_DN6567_c0_g1_i1.p1 TRINITY_DN6567_c0_g1~~TRINITY_DN6567_c0_g1_i1.p1  ORF type:complete len:341 (+),score=88.13 TRINITY_DN6567_c0_g1_i1:139-1161(+)
MLLDLHCILGYIIAKFFVAIFVAPSNASDLALPSFGYDRVGHGGYINSGRSMAKRLYDWFLRTPMHQRLVIYGMVMANLPDIDVVLAPILGWHTVHRGPTHSLIVMLLASVFISIPASKRLKASYMVTFVITYACVASHILADFATQQGTTLLWPFGKSYSFGALSTLDLPLLVFMYSMFTLSRRNLVSPLVLLPVLIAVLCFYVCFKRVLIYQVVRNIRTNANIYSTLWAMPSNMLTGKFFVIEKSEGVPAVIVKSKWVSPTLLEPLEALFWSRPSSARTRPPRRGWFWGMGHMSRVELFMDALPSLLLIAAYHIGYFVYQRWEGSKQRDRTLHAEKIF